MKTDITKAINLKSSKSIAMLTMQTYLKDTQYSQGAEREERIIAIRQQIMKNPMFKFVFIDIFKICYSMKDKQMVAFLDLIMEIVSELRLSDSSLMKIYKLCYDLLKINNK